ncbi:MAG TPA: IPT/TIG domain-containing protein [Solirubrobacteraceae bacterium]|nr:IPT/TIG domain-containing protein [Solirubrobacteraceae bacterium]
MARARRRAVWRADSPRGADRAARAGRRRALCGALAAFALTVWLLAAAGGASAVIVHLHGGPIVSYQPLRGAPPRALDEYFSNLDYNGGPVMASNTNYTVYWDPAGAPKYPAGYQAGVDRYLEDLAHDSGGHGNVDSVSSQYNDAAGSFSAYDSHFGGELIDTDPYPVNGCKEATICLTDAQLRKELSTFVKAQGLATDLEHEYFLLTPPKVEDCFEAAGFECSAGSKAPYYCAYHGNQPEPAGGELIYSNDPYVGGNRGCDDGNHPNEISDSALEGGLSHEHNESITDPEPNNAWTDLGGSGGEIGDKCRTFEAATEYGTPVGVEGGKKYNQVINGHHYWYQQEWSNQTDQCLQRFTLAGVEPTATFTSAPKTGTSVSFNAGSSTAPGGVFRFNWQFNDGPGLAIPTETSTPTVTHTFPKEGAYTVALTVFASNGTSIGAARTVIVGTPPAPVVTHLAPAKGPASGETSVTITGKNLAGATAVHFGAAAASFTVSSNTQIVAVSPAGAAGTSDVTVQTPGGTSAIMSADHFKYLPTVTAVSPSSGTTAGNQEVTVTGSGFVLGTSETAIRFGSAKAASVDCTSSTSCTVRTPPHPAGTVDVIATVAGVASVKSPPADQYTYS